MPSTRSLILRSVLFSLVLACQLSGCQSLQVGRGLRSSLAKAEERQAKFAEYPQFKIQAYQFFKTPQQQNQYIFTKVTDYIYEQMAKEQDFSDAHFLRLLQALPQDLVLVYSTLYLEQEIKRDNLAGYFHRSRGFLTTQAIQGYQKLGFYTVAEQLHQALKSYLQARSQGKRWAQNLNGPYANWKTEPLQIQRAKYISQALPTWVEN